MQAAGKLLNHSVEWLKKPTGSGYLGSILLLVIQYIHTLIHCYIDIA